MLESATFTIETRVARTRPGLSDRQSPDAILIEAEKGRERARPNRGIMAGIRRLYLGPPSACRILRWR
jgi:hypothetical protein